MSRVSSVEEFIREIFKNRKNDDRSIMDTAVFYRGESEEYEYSSCQPGIFRSKNLVKNEHNLFKEFILKNPEAFERDKLTIDKLTRMQHYGLATRLLDISSNALIALFHACKNKSKDGVVYIFTVPNKKIKFYDSDTISVLANLAKREKFDFPYNYEKDKECFNKQPDIQFLLHNIKDEKPYFKDAIVPEHLHSVICVKPLQNNKRIVNQQGAFLIFGNHKKNKNIAADIGDSGFSRHKIYIAGKDKRKIIDGLESLGISQAIVYPDLSDIADYLNKKYKEQLI